MFQVSCSFASDSWTEDESHDEVLSEISEPPADSDSDDSDLPDFVSSDDEQELPQRRRIWEESESEEEDEEESESQWIQALLSRIVPSSGTSGKIFGGGSDGQKSVVEFVTPQKGQKRKFDDVSADAVVPFSPSVASGAALVAYSPSVASGGAMVAYSPSVGSGSGRKPQRALESFWGQSGPQVAVQRSPEHMLKCEQYMKEQAIREQLARDRMAKLPGEWLPPVAATVHSGGTQGGRPATGPVRGVAAGGKSNRRQLGESVLRRDPSLAFKLAVIMQVEQAASDSSSIPTVVRREVERSSGFEWKVIQKWIRRKLEFQSEFTRLKLGKTGLRVFGSTLPSTKRSSHSTGARIRGPTVNYQSAVLRQLRQWFERERMHGHEVSTSLLQDFYVKFLERQSAVCKAHLLHISQQCTTLKQSAKSSGWG